MRVLILTLVLLLQGAISTAASAKPEPLPAAALKAARPIRTDGAILSWNENDGAPKAFSAGALTLLFTRTEVSDRDVRPRLRIFKGGQQVADLTDDGGFLYAQAWVAVGRFDAAVDAPGVLFITYTGGAHCCLHEVLAEEGPSVPPNNIGDAWRHVTVTDFQGGEPKSFKDVDGDGVLDIVGPDDRFAYAFASFAGSWMPPRIFDVQAYAAKDVSDRLGFRRLFEEDLVKARAACVAAQFEINGTCAAWAADAARLGRLEAAWPEIMKRYDRASKDWPSGCKITVAEGEVCPKDQVIEYADFPTALRAFLIETNYLAKGWNPPHS